MFAACCGDAASKESELVVAPAAAKAVPNEPEAGKEFRKKGSGTIRALRAAADQAAFLEEVSDKRLLHIKGYSEGLQLLERQDAAAANEQKKQAVEAMLAFNPDYLVVDGEPFGDGFQHYAKEYLDTRRAFMEPPSLIWVTSAVDRQTKQAESWAEQGFAVTVCFLTEDQIATRLSAIFGPAAAAALGPLGAQDRGGVKLLVDGAVAPEWSKGLRPAFKALVEQVEKRSDAKYFAKSSMEATARGSAAFDLFRAAMNSEWQTFSQGVLCAGGSESTILELSAIYMNDESGIADDVVAVYPFKRGGEATPLPLHVGKSFKVEDLDGWIRQISGATVCTNASTWEASRPSEKAGEKKEEADGEKAEPGVAKNLSVIGAITQHWTTAVVGEASKVTALNKTPLMLGTSKMVDLLNVLSEGMGNYLKSDVEKVNRSKAPQLKDGDDFKQWLLGEMPVHAATKYKNYVDDSAFMGQLWVGRQLEFWVEVMAGLQSGKATKEAADTAYKATLKKHHGFTQVTAFSAALRKLPDKSAMMGKLQGEATVEDFADELKAFIALGRGISKYQLALDKEIDGLRAQEQKSYGKKR